MIKPILTLVALVFAVSSIHAQWVGFNLPAGVGCAPYVATFTNTSSQIDTYLWDFGDGTTSTSSGSTVQHTYTSGGNFEVSLKGWSQGDYVGEYRNWLYVEGLPVTFNHPPVCVGDHFQINTDAWTASGFSWDMGDGTTSNDSHTFHSYDSPGLYTISLDVNYPQCGQYSGTINLPVTNNNTPMDYGFFWVNSDSICPGDEIGFSGNYYYELYIDYGDGSTASQPAGDDNYSNDWRNHVYAAAGVYYPSLTLVNGCGRDTTMYDTLVVSSSYNSQPYAYFYFEEGDTVCAGSDVAMSYSSNGISSTWNLGNGTILSNPEERITETYLNIGQYYLELEIINGCGSVATFKDTLHIRDDIPVAEFNYSMDDSVCLGSSTFVFSSLNDEEDNNNYVWDLGDGSTVTGSQFTHEYDALGTYYTSLTVTNKCGLSATERDTIVVSDNFGFGPQSFVQTFPEKACVGDTVLIVFIPGGGNTYEVDYGGGYVTETPIRFDPGQGFTYDVIKHTYNTPGLHNAQMRVTNACGAERIEGLTFDFNGSVEPEVDFIFDQNKPLCVGQPLDFYPIGARLFTWDFGDGTGVQTSNGMLNKVEHVFAEPGTYQVILSGRDACGNVSSDTSEVIIPDTRVYVTANAIDATCGNNDGLALASVSGGTPPYSYAWTSGDTAIIADSLSSGIYQVNVVDAIGCTSFDIATVSDQEAATIVVNTVLDVSCNGGSDGAIDINIIGGNPPFTFEWSNGKTTEDVNNLAAGPHEVFVTDAYGCVATASITVGEPADATVTFVKKNSDCGQANGFATVFVSGSSGPYSYIWSNGQGSETISGLGAGIYEVNVIDGNGCLYTDQIIIDDIQGPKAFVDSISPLDCGGAGSSVFTKVFGGTPPYDFTWSNGATTANLPGVNAGDYELTVVDDNNCQASLMVSIAVDPPLANPICLLTVDTARHTNQIVWERTATTGIDYYNIYRESSLSGLYYLVASVPSDSTSYFTDPVADPFIQSWRYKVSAVSECGIESELSDIHKTIHLTSNIGVGGVVNLIWDHYEGFSYPTYHIWRYSDIDGWNNIASVSSQNTSYTDATPPAGATNLGYIIEIDPPSTCTATRANTDFNSSRSNRSQAVGSIAMPLSVVDHHESINHLKVYPNPGNGNFNVELNFLNAEEATLEVTDIAGKVVYQQAVSGHGVLLEQLNLSNLKNGMYVLNVRSEGGIISERIVLQH